MNWLRLLCYNVCLQVAGVGDVEDICVFLFVLPGIGLCDLAFADAGDAVQENLIMLDQCCMKLPEFLFSAAEVRAGPGQAVVDDIVRKDGGQASGWRKLGLANIPLHEGTGQAEKQNVGQKGCFLLFCFTGVLLAEFSLFALGNAHIAQEQGVDVLDDHGAVRKTWEDDIQNGYFQILSMAALLIEAANGRARLCKPVQPL